MRDTKVLQNFRKKVWAYYKAHGRHDLVWRTTNDPYRILVSEIMLQQTQVSRVIEKYKEFLKEFPTTRVLAKASLADVLKVWSGLGYNRRGKYLHDAAKVIVEKYGGKIPRETSALRALPGVGPYTASAVRVFAFNEPDVLIETNVRTSFFHHFFSNTHKTHDRVLCVCAEKAAKEQDPRTWHWALMDYGSYLKRTGVRNNSRSKHYTKQSKFEGSLRQVRGAVLRELREGPSTLKALKFGKKKMQNALASLARDGLVGKRKKKWEIV